MIQQNKTFLPMSDSIIKYSEMCIDRAYLINLTNHENLKEIEKLKLKIDSKYQSVSEIGIHLTQLRILILDGSYLQSLRDFGNQFPYLQVLSVNECSLNDLDGIACFQSLIELHAANNRISELASIGFLDFLEVLNLSGTDIVSFETIEDLTVCTRLHTLSLQHTLLTKVPSYREVVSYLLQSLYILDDIPVNNRPVMSNRVMEEARHLLQELVYEVDEERRFESTILEQSIEAESVGIDYGSELTFGDGTVLAGNAALMRRRRNLHIGDSVVSKVAVQTPGHAIVNFSKVKTVHNDSIPKKTINDVTNRSRQVIAPSKDISDAKRSSIFLNFTLSEEQKSALKLSATPSNNFADRCKTHELGTDSSSSSVSDSETSSKKPLCRSGLFDLTGGLHAIEAWAAEESSESPKSEVGTQKVVEFPDPLRRSELKTTYEDPLNSPDLCSTLPSVSDERCTEDQYKGDNDMDDDADLEYRFADIRHPPKNYIRIKPSGTEPDSELNMNLIRGLKSKPSSMCPYTNFKSTINTTVSTRRRPIGNVDTPTDT